MDASDSRNILLKSRLQNAFSSKFSVTTTTLYNYILRCTVHTKNNSTQLVTTIIIECHKHHEIARNKQTVNIKSVT